MRRIILFCINYSKLCLGFFIIITLFFAWQAKSVKIDSNLKNILPTEEGAFDDLDSYMFLGFRAKDGGELFSLESMDSLSKVISEIEKLPEIRKTISIFNTETLLLGSSGRLIPGTKLPGGRFPQTDKELKKFEKDILEDPFMKNLIVSNDGTYIMTIFLTNTASEDNQLFNKEFRRIVEPLNKIVDVSLTGDLVLINRAEYYLTKDFSTLLFAALIVMLIILFISFRARRALLLPVLVVLVGVIWTIGFTALIGFKLSIVTSVVPALVLTIGSSYTIHVLNEFFRNAPIDCSNDKKWIAEAVNHVNKTIIMASLTTMIGFLSLLSSSQQTIKEFAVSVSFGVGTTALLSLFLLPAIFSMLKDPSQLHHKVTKNGKLTIFLGSIGKFVYRYRIILILSGVVLGVTTVLCIPRLSIGSDYYNYFPEDDSVIKELMYVTEMSGGTIWVNMTLKAPEGTTGYFGTPEGLEVQSRMENEIKKNTYVYDVISMVGYLKKINKLRFGKYEIPKRKGLLVLLKRTFDSVFSTNDGFFKEANLVDKNYNEVTFVVRLYDRNRHAPLAENDFPIFMDSIKNTLSFADTKDVKYRFWGLGYVTNTVSRILLKDQVSTLLISFFLVFLVACIYFKSFYYGLVTIIPLITAICANYICMVLLNIPLDITTIMVSSVAIGVGVDDAIHFLIQYINQLKKYPDDISKVLYYTFKITGRPIVLTTVSIVAGMLVLNLASFTPIGYFGLLVSLALVGALIGTLLFLPAVLVLIHEANKKLKLVLSFRG